MYAVPEDPRSLGKIGRCFTNFDGTLGPNIEGVLTTPDSQKSLFNLLRQNYHILDFFIVR